MGGVGEEAEEAYQSALNALCRHGKELVSIVAAEYRDLPASQYLDRWSLIQLLTDLPNSASLPFLDDLLSIPIPPEESANPHSFSTAGEEVMIRTTAAEAVTQIAADGDRKALDILLKHARHESFSVKRACIQGYLTHGGPDARDVLTKLLPERDLFILDIQRRDVRQVPQAAGGESLACRDKDELPPHRLPDGRKEEGE